MAAPHSSETIKLLSSIDRSLKKLVSQQTDGGSGAVAPDSDLDGKYGDPEVKFMPRDWNGESYKGALFSQCPPELLDLLAGTFDYFADKADENNEVTAAGKPVAPYKRKDAARARGWAKRKRSGWRAPDAGDDLGATLPLEDGTTAPAATDPFTDPANPFETDDDVPF